MSYTANYSKQRVPLASEDVLKNVPIVLGRF